MRVVANSKRHLTVAFLISSILLVGFANVSYYAEHLLPVILSTNDNVLRIMSDRSSIYQKEPSNNAATVKAIQKQKNDSLLRGTGNTESESMKQVPDTKQQSPANTHHINTTLGQQIRKNTSSNARKEENNTTASKTKNDAPSDKNTTASLEASNKTRDANTATTTATMEESPLNDKTIPWPAMSSLSTKQPRSTQILLTNYGWNHPNQTIGLTHARSIRSTQLLQGIIQHPFFNPISWTKVSSQPTNMTTFVFLDVEMCFETNWPHYGGLTGSNVDTVQNRSTQLRPMVLLLQCSSRSSSSAYILIAKSDFGLVGLLWNGNEILLFESTRYVQDKCRFHFRNHGNAVRVRLGIAASCHESP